MLLQVGSFVCRVMNKKNMYIGWDIGGAHTKYTIIKENSLKITSKIFSLKLWESLDPLKKIINEIQNEYGNVYQIKNAITMSGEMCDIFLNRKKGVKEILSLFSKRSFYNYIYTANNGVIPIHKFKDFRLVASMNWHIIASCLKSIGKNIIAIDLGSTTTDIILIKNNKCINRRTDDYSGLKSSELLYTGILRTPTFSVTKYVKYNNQKYNLIPEFYSTMGDIYRLLGVISLKDDYSDTADGRSKSQINTLTRISRSLGLDYDKKDKELITNISKKIMSAHLDQISYNIIGHLKKNFNNTKDLQFTGMGVGRNIIKKICRKSKWNYINLEDALGYSNIDAVNNLSTNTPSFLLTLLLKKIHE